MAKCLYSLSWPLNELIFLTLGDIVFSVYSDAVGENSNGGSKQSNRMFWGTKRMFLDFWGQKMDNFSTNVLKIHFLSSFEQKF